MNLRAGWSFSDLCGVFPLNLRGVWSFSDGECCGGLGDIRPPIGRLLPLSLLLVFFLSPVISVSGVLSALEFLPN